MVTHFTVNEGIRVRFPIVSPIFSLWLSLVERRIWDAKVVGSNPTRETMVCWSSG